MTHPEQSTFKITCAFHILDKIFEHTTEEPDPALTVLVPVDATRIHLPSYRERYLFKLHTTSVNKFMQHGLANRIMVSAQTECKKKQ